MQSIKNSSPEWMLPLRFTSPQRKWKESTWFVLWPIRKTATKRKSTTHGKRYRNLRRKFSPNFHRPRKLAHRDRRSESWTGRIRSVSRLPEMFRKKFTNDSRACNFQYKIFPRSTTNFSFILQTKAYGRRNSYRCYRHRRHPSEFAARDTEKQRSWQGRTRKRKKITDSYERMRLSCTLLLLFIWT